MAEAVEAGILGFAAAADHTGRDLGRMEATLDDDAAVIDTTLAVRESEAKRPLRTGESMFPQRGDQHPQPRVVAGQVEDGLAVVAPVVPGPPPVADVVGQHGQARVVRVRPGDEEQVLADPVQDLADLVESFGGAELMDVIRLSDEASAPATASAPREALA